MLSKKTELSIKLKGKYTADLLIYDQEDKPIGSLWSYLSHRKLAVGHPLSISHWLGRDDGLRTPFGPAEFPEATCALKGAELAVLCFVFPSLAF